MATSRSLVLSVFLSGLCFSTGALFLVAIGSRPITLEIDEKPLFTGRIQDLASPYLAAVTGLSLGVGMTAFALLGWQESSRRLNRATDQISSLKQQLHHQEGMVESLKFSEAKLQAMGLKFFLDAMPHATFSQAISSNPAPPHSAPAAPFPHSVEPDQAASTNSSSNASLVGMPYPHLPQNNHLPQNHYPSQNHHPTPQSNYPPQNHHPTPQIEELMTAMRQIMHQIEQLKTAQIPDHSGSVDASIGS